MFGASRRHAPSGLKSIAVIDARGGALVTVPSSLGDIIRRCAGLSGLCDTPGAQIAIPDRPLNACGSRHRVPKVTVVPLPIGEAGSSVDDQRAFACIVVDRRQFLITIG
jgi:hypothetical protein